MITMAYVYNITKRNGKKPDITTREKGQRLVLASLAIAAGIFLYPLDVEATTITPKDAGDAAKIHQVDNVYNIDPQKVSGEFAYNRFSAFSLDAGSIANLEFGSASTLANLVNSQININGIVNAVLKDGKIGGHLMFLSPDGIAVGASGVINAGQLTGIVPNKVDFDKLYNSTQPDIDITMEAIDTIKAGSYANDKRIDIDGQINTHSGVMLGAGIININDGAKIQSTKDLDFTNLVNTGTANAGLNGLTASQGTGGDIIITAKQTSAVKDTKIEKDANNQDKEVANAIRWGDRSTDLLAAVNIGKNVTISSSDGSVKLTAESTSTYEDSTPMTLTNTLKSVILGDDKTVLDGVIDKLAGKEAGANKYLFVNYSSKKNKSAVNIGANSIITAKNIDIAATSKVEIKQSVAVPSQGKDSNGNTVENTSAMPVAAVAISRVYNTADVVIDGNLTANGANAKTGDGIKISANADTKAELSATASGGANTSAVVGVAVLTGDTKSKVIVNTPATGATALTATQGKVSIDADTTSNINVNVNAVGPTSYVVSNVGVVNYDSNADVTMNRSINAGAVDIKAVNTTTGMKLTVDNEAKSDASNKKETAGASQEEQNQDDEAANAEKNKPDSEKSQDEKNSEKKSIDPTKVVKDANVDTNDAKTKDATGTDGKGGIKGVKDKVEGTNEGGDNSKKNSAFGLGAAVGVVSNTNDANITIGNNAVIKATKVSDTVDGSVKMTADSLMTASKENEGSLGFKVNNTQANANAQIGAAVLVSNVKNNAKVVLDNEGDKSAQIKGEAVSIDASAGMGKYKKTESEEKTSTLTYNVGAKSTAENDTPSKFALDGSVGVDTLKNNAIVLMGQKSHVDGSSVKLSADATTSAEGTYGATEENGKVGIGATVGLQNISGNALVMAGKGAEIKGTDSLEASSSNTLETKNQVKNAGKGDSIGISGMVALSYGDSNSVVSLDDEVNITTGLATITSTNSTNVDNSARSESTGQNGAKAFGIGVGIVNYDVNSLAMISDNGSGINAPSGNTTDVEKAAKKIYEDAALARSIAGDTLVGKLGDKTANGTKGSITTGGLVGVAITTGMIQNDAKAKVVSASSDDGEENSRQDSEKWTKWSQKGTEGANEAKNKTQQLEQDNVTSQNESVAPNATGAMGEASRAADPDGTNNTEDAGAAPSAGSAKSAGASIGIEGSVALTFLGGRTDTILDNVTVKNETVENEIATPAPVAAVSLSATDFLGSITLGGTDIKHSVNAGDSGTKVGIGGTFAMNSSNRDVDSLIRNTDMPMALMVSNSATKIGIEVAAGMGVSASSGDGTNINGAGVVYYNKAKQDIHALMLNNNIMGASVSNKATSTDYQIAGGLAGTKGSGANTNVGIGGAAAISNLENNLSSGILGGNYTVFSSMDVEAQKGTTQINAALAGTKGGYGFEGAFAYGSTKNNTHAYVDGATVTGLTASAVNVKAGEIPVVKSDTQLNEEKTKLDNKIDSSIGTNPNSIDTTKNYATINDGTKTQLTTQLKNQTNSALEKEKKAQDDNKKTLDDMGLDTTGESYLDKRSAASSLDEDNKNTDEGKIAGDAAKDEDDAKGELGKNHSLTITAAMGGGWNDTAGAGAGIAYNYVKNDIAADIKGSTITADTVSGEAASDATIVSVGAGVAIGGKTFNGAGSGSWNDLKNDTKVTIENNTITGKNISGQAQNTASIINIAGEVAGGKGMAVGLSLAYNSLNNTTGTYLKGNTVTLKDGDNSVKLASTSMGKTLAVAGGVNVNISQSAFGAVGTVAINKGVSNTESVIDGKTTGENTKLDNVSDLSVTAEELAKRTTVAGSVSVGGKKVGVGGAVAYTDIGSSNNKERLRAEINHADITTTENGKIEVSTKDSKTDGNTTDKSRIITVGAGFGVQWGKNFFNLQGGAAVLDIYKNSFAALNNTNINASNTAKHPVINVTADTRSKINTVGVGGSVDISSQVKGVAGVAINRMYQDTKAEMNTNSGTTTVNAGLTQVRAAGNGDIHSVGVGGLVGVGGQVVFAGSGSYNYIGNNVDAIIKNQNLTSNNSVGVVAQSDDSLYNFAGGFAIGANTKVGLGAAVSINKITGSTNALVNGGSLTAADEGSIKVTRPQDDKLFTTEKIDLTTDRTRLSASRTEETKTGIVVDSSATHTIISQMSSGGVAASGSVGVNLAGTVNLNYIQGEKDKKSSTTAKIQDTDINSNGNASNVNVNAVDYSNLGSFTGTPSVGAASTAGVSVGVSANWETLARWTEAEISASSKKNLYAKNLTVDAIAKHGSSSLSFAAAAGAAATAGVASGDSIMRHKNTSTVNALLKNMNAIFDGTAEVKAEHLGNNYTQNISVSAAGGYAAVAAGAGVSVMDDTSTVKAEVASSDLKAKESTAGKNISVLAKNDNNWKNTLVTASLAVGLGAGLAANVGINNTTSETAALVTNSQLEAYDVAVNAQDKLTVNSTGGVGAGGIGGVGVAVTLNNINSSTSAHVTGGSATAANAIDVKANETRSFDSQVTGVGAGGIGVGVNVAVTSINKGITDAQLSNAKDENDKVTDVNATTQNEISKHLSSVNGTKGALGTGAKFFGLSSKDSDLQAARNVQISLKTNTDKQGVHTEVNGATMSAANDVNVIAKDISDISAKNVGVTAAGAASINVTDAIIHTNYDTDVTMKNATISGKNVNVEALQTQSGDGSKVGVTAVTVGALGGVGVGYAGIVNKSATDVDITGSTIIATGNSADDKGVTINAKDESKHKADILSVGVAALNVTTTFASVENYSNVGVTLNETNNVSAAKNITIEAKKANTLEAHTQGVGVGGVNVAVNHATIEDGEKDKNGKIVKGNATAQITGTTSKFTAEAFHLGAINDTTAKLSAGNTAVSLLGVSRMRGKGVMTMGADVDVAGGAFQANTVEFSSMLGNATGRTLEGNVKGHNISGVAVAPDLVTLTTDVTSKVNVKDSTFGTDTNLILGNESHVDRKAYIYDVTAGAVAVGNTSADIKGTQTMITTLAGKAGVTNNLANLLMGTYGENTGKAFADAGGGGVLGYVGAHVDNKSINTINSTISGKWNLTGEAYLVAVNKDNARLTASEGHGGVIGVGGTSVDNTINTTTKATVADNTEIIADRVHIGTSNTINTGAYDDTNSKGVVENQSYTLKDHFGGAISGNRLRSLLDVTEKGTITIGNNAKITTNNLQEYIASSQNDMVNHASAKGGAALGVVDTVVENNITVNNSIDVKSGALLSNEKEASKEDITLAAYDENKLNSHAEATVGGVAGVMVGKNLNKLDRESKVNVAGTIESGSKVGLYAGANEDGVLSNINADLKAGVYNHTAIPVSSPTVKYDIKNDKGLVDVSGIVRSTGDINVIASGGKERVAKDESLYNWVLGGSSTDKKFLSSDAVVAEEAMPKGNTVKVTGALIAGTADPINITIRGSVAEGLKVEPTTSANNNDANKKVIAGITQGTFDYANTLSARLEELKTLISAYNGNNKEDGSADVMAAYIAERDRIQSDMRRLGLVEKDTDGNDVYTSTGRSVYYVEIPDIATSGGNINVQSNDFIGTGKLHANSAPGITITNQSDAYLKLNNIIMGEKGGQITYNGIDNVIPAGVSQGNAKINETNVSNKTGAVFSEIYGVNEGQTADLTVQNTFQGSTESTIIVTEAMKQQMRQEINKDTTLTTKEKTDLLDEINRYNSFSYTAIPDVEVNGKISNFHGEVSINNASGDIRINGGTQNRPTGVFGTTVKLTAAKGTIAQNYKEGIVNINGNPEMYLNSYTSYTDNKLITDAEKNMDYEQINFLGTTIYVRKSGSNKSGSATTNYTRPASAQTATGYIAGRDVYVSASNINVNGLIQSGYKNYYATVTEAELNTAKSQPAGKAAVVQNRTMYKVNEGGAKWNSTEQVFDYVAQVYWDPSTDKLVVEDIDTQGGKVYLTGKIASTGDGRVLAADGAAKITVTNETALDMNVGKVLNNQREGIITIADTAKDTWTEYRRGQTKSINNYSQYLKDHSGESSLYTDITPVSNELSVTNTLNYTPKANQTYNWTKGKTVESTKEYEHFKRYGLWGAVKTQDVNSLRSEAKVIKEATPREYGLPEGAVIKQDSDTNLGENTLRLDTTSNRLSGYVSEPKTTLRKSGFFGWFRNYTTRWEEGEKTLKVYNYSINASKQIKIGLIGEEKGSINIASTNNVGGNINLTGNVANSHNEATLNISSAGGSINQFDNTTLKSEIVNLTAKDDIKNIHIASIGATDGNKVTDNIKLSAVSTNKGDIDITAVGGLLNNQSLPGNVEIVALKSQNGNAAFSNNVALGDVTLNAAGNITQSGSGTTVEGRGITLNSKKGGIGTANQAITIAGSDVTYSTDRYGAQINAEAKDSIYLTEAEAGGNMRVGKIASEGGDVNLTVNNGSFIDGLPGDDKSGSTDSVDDMVHRWIDAGLIDGEKDAQGNYTYKGAYIEGLERERDKYKADIEAAYADKTKAQWQEELDAQKAAYQSYLDKKAYHEGLNEEQIKELEENGDRDYIAYKRYSAYSSYTSADEYVKAHSVAYKYAQYDDANDYLSKDAEYQKLVSNAQNPTFEWTKDMMLYAVSDKIVNPNSGSSTQTERTANVLGNNVTLTATKGAVGTFSDQTKTITLDQLTGNEGIAKMKELMNVDASDVTAKRDAQGNLLSFEIKGNMPLGIKASGTLDVRAGGNVSVAGRKNASGEQSAINVGTIDATQNSATGDVRLYSEKGIYNAKTANDTNIIGKNLNLTGGKESIGEDNKPLNISLTGDLVEARANKNVFIKNMKDTDYLRLGAMFAGNIISLHSNKGFKMSTANIDIAESYINAGQTLKFNANTENGIVGENNNPIRILNDRAPVNIEAQSAYIRGMGSMALGIQNGTLVLGKIKTTGAFTATSDGSLAVGREAEKDSTGKVVKPAVVGSINTGGDATLTAKDNLRLDGAVTTGDLQNAKKTLTLTATNGIISQTDKGAITADKVNTINGNSLLLENTGNKFNSITVDSGSTADIAGDVRIKDNADALTVKINQKVAGDTANKLAGDISVQNLKANGTLTNEGNLTATGSISLNSNGDLTQKTGTVLTAGKDVNATSTDGAMSINGDIAAANGNITLSAKEDLQTAGMLTANQNVNATSTDGAMSISGDITAKDSIALRADDALTQGENVLLVAGKDVTLTSAKNAITQKASGGIQAPKVTTVSAKDVDLQGTGNKFNALDVQSSDKDMPIQGSVSVLDNVDKLTLSVQPTINGDIAVENQKANGVLQVASELQAKGNGAEVKGDITLKSDGSMQTDKKITAANNVKVTSTNGAMTVDGDVSTTNGDITLSTKEKMQLNSKLTAGNNVNVTSTNGAMTVDGDVSATNGDITLSTKEKMQLNGKLTADKDVDVTSTNGAMTVDGDVSADNGDIVLQSKEEMQTSGKLTSSEDVKLTSDTGNVSINGDISTGVQTPTGIDLNTGALQGSYNSLVITAGGAIQEKAGVNITAPMVKTYSGKDVSLESAKNEFGAFFADGFAGSNEINGSVKAVTNASSDDNNVFSVGIGADIYGDAEFTNLHENGSIGMLISGADHNEIAILGNDKGAEGNLVLKANQNVNLFGDTNAVHDIVIDSAKGKFTGIGRGMTAGNDITVSVGKGATYVGTTELGMTAGHDIKVSSSTGNIIIGAMEENGEKTLRAENNITIETGRGTISILGEMSTAAGDITMTAGQDSYEEGSEHGSFIIASDGKLVSNGGITLNGRNGDIVITDDIQAKKELNVNIAGQGNAGFGTDVAVTNDVNISTDKGNIAVGHTVTSSDGNIKMTTGEGNIYVDKAVTAGQDLAIITDKGDITIGDNGPDVKTVTAKQDATVGTALGIVTIYGKTSAETGDVTLYAGSDQYDKDQHTIVIEQNGKVEAGRDVNLGALNDDILVTDRIYAERDVTAAVTGKGRIFFPGNEVKSDNEVNIAMENGDLVLNRVEGKRVSVWLENNSELSYLGEVLADANGTAAPDVTLTGNYITVGSMTKRNGTATFKFSATGAGDQKYIAQEISVGSLKSSTGTQMSSLWSKRGYLHVEEGNFKADDVLAGDKIYLDNAQTNLAIFGRTPTRDGEQLVYWNNLSMAYDKERSFQLYADGKVRTNGAVLIDADRNYGKLYGDNLSVLDMMRERVTSTHGQYVFDVRRFTEPGVIMRRGNFLDMKPLELDIRQKNASNSEIVVE